jgi:hypothetical protein
MAEGAHSRRELLGKLAGGAAEFAVTSMITTAEAFADSGTEACRFSYLTTARVNVGVGRVAEDPRLFGNDEVQSHPGRNVTPARRCRFARLTGTTNLPTQFSSFQNLGTMTMTMTMTATSAPNLATC